MPHSNIKTDTMSSNETIILVAKFDYQKKDSQELDLRKNERLILLDNSKKWWLVKKVDKNDIG
jgi:hypothetical protein